MVAGATSAFLRPTPLLVSSATDRRTAFSAGVTVSSPRSPAPPCAAASTATATSSWYAPVDVSPRPAPTASLYEVLGLPGGATAEEIKSAYRRLARGCHPDVRRGGESADEFMRLRAAYSTLLDPETRAEYDRRMMMLRRASSFSPRTSPATAATVLRRRSWETDQCW